MSCISSRESTLPLGFCGVFTMIARVFFVNAWRSRSGSSRQSGFSSGMNFGEAPHKIASGP